MFLWEFLPLFSPSSHSLLLRERSSLERGGREASAIILQGGYGGVTCTTQASWGKHFCFVVMLLCRMERGSTRETSSEPWDDLPVNTTIKPRSDSKSDCRLVSRTRRSDCWCEIRKNSLTAGKVLHTGLQDRSNNNVYTFAAYSFELHYNSEHYFLKY